MKLKANGLPIIAKRSRTYRTMEKKSTGSATLVDHVRVNKFEKGDVVDCGRVPDEDER